MENFDTEFITSLLNEEKTTEEVSLILQDMYSNKRELPLRSLKRYCAKYHKAWNIKEDTPKYAWQLGSRGSWRGVF